MKTKEEDTFDSTDFEQQNAGDATRRRLKFENDLCAERCGKPRVAHG